jgi:hypothetical protein
MLLRKTVLACPTSAILCSQQLQENEMKKTAKKLVLAKETVRSLGERQDNLKDAAGGKLPPVSCGQARCETISSCL